MEEQRRILEAQIAEAQERKKMEKEKEKLDDILDEVRVKSELGIIDVDKKRKAQLTKSVAEEQDKLNRAQQEVLKRKGLISNMTSPDRQQAVSISHVLILCIFKCVFNVFIRCSMRKIRVFGYHHSNGSITRNSRITMHDEQILIPMLITLAVLIMGIYRRRFAPPPGSILSSHREMCKM
jgi:hypothetical protein